MKEFTCIYCSEPEINRYSNKQKGIEPQYSCNKCGAEYDQKTFIKYHSLTATQKIVFRYKYWLLNKLDN